MDGGKRTFDGGWWMVEGGKRRTFDCGKWTFDGERWMMHGRWCTVDGRRRSGRQKVVEVDSEVAFTGSGWLTKQSE